VAAVQDYLIADESCVKQPCSCRYNWTPPAPACIAIFAFAMLISCSIRRTPLHSAARFGHVDVAQLLLLHNAAVDAKHDGYRPYRCIVDENTFLIFGCVVPLIFASDFLVPLAMVPPYTRLPVMAALTYAGC
jgi:hypothetical protein